MSKHIVLCQLDKFVYSFIILYSKIGIALVLTNKLLIFKFINKLLIYIISELLNLIRCDFDMWPTTIALSNLSLLYYIWIFFQ